MIHDVAVFLDLDNLTIGADEVGLTFDVDLVLDAVRTATGGRIVSRQAYGDWRQHQNIPRQLAAAGFSLHSMVRLGPSDKNLADIQMVADAIETLLHGHNWQSYILATGDRDLIPLVQLLQRHGKQVIGLGLRHTASNNLVDLCDRYIFYDELSLEQNREQDGQLEQWLRQAAETLFVGGVRRVPASTFREQLQKVSHDQFGQSPQGKGAFGKLLERFPLIVRLEREESTLYACAVQPEADSRVDLPELAAAYRAAMKKRGLRIVEADQRLAILYQVVRTIRKKGQQEWQAVVEHVVTAHAESDKGVVSRSMVNDVMRMARRARIIQAVNGGQRPLAELPIALALEGERLYQQAVIACDKLLLDEIRQLKEHPFEPAAAALALYDTLERVSYIEYLMR